MEGNYYSPAMPWPLLSASLSHPRVCFLLHAVFPLRVRDVWIPQSPRARLHRHLPIRRFLIRRFLIRRLLTRRMYLLRRQNHLECLLDNFCAVEIHWRWKFAMQPPTLVAHEDLLKSDDSRAGLRETCNAVLIWSCSGENNDLSLPVASENFSQFFQVGAFRYIESMARTCIVHDLLPSYAITVSQILANTR